MARRQCPNCGKMVDAAELALLDHSAELQGCLHCRAAIAAAGHHQAAGFDPKRNPAHRAAYNEHKTRLAANRQDVSQPKELTT